MSLDLAGGETRIDVPDGFFGHMLEALAKHGGLGMSISAVGDTHVDLHHTVEDVGIVLGDCLREALGDGAGITRFATAHAPLDEALARAVVDVSGRGFLACRMPEEMAASWVTSTFPMTLVEDFFHALADRGRITLHLDLLHGRNPHHAAEACFKAGGRGVALGGRAAGRIERRPQHQGHADRLTRPWPREGEPICRL